MRYTLTIVAAATLLATLGGCAAKPQTTYVKRNADQYDIAITRLDCTKARLEAYRNSLRSHSAADPYARQKASAAASHAGDRCARQHGYRRVN
jgi:molybdate-binding protein